METTTETLSNLARQLKLTGLGSVIGDLLLTAGQKQISYVDFTMDLLSADRTWPNVYGTQSSRPSMIWTYGRRIMSTGYPELSSLISGNVSGLNNILTSS